MITILMVKILRGWIKKIVVPQHISSRHVHRCLKEVRSTPSGKLERKIATETYLMIVVDYIDIFMSHSLNLWERV